jgi:RNA polymerase sigma-70 factor (ECF subfamily)
MPLVQRYNGAVFRYLLGAVRDADVAADLTQEFALRFVRGDFRRADPQRGRFRDYLKASLVNLVNDYHRARQAWPRPLAGGAEPVAPPADTMDAEADFLKSWREELLDRAWDALSEAQPDYYAVLLFRVENPDASSTQMADQLSTRLGKPLMSAWIRKALQRAHERYADLLLNEVAGSLETASEEELRHELKELDLLRFCRSALERRAKTS